MKKLLSTLIATLIAIFSISSVSATDSSLKLFGDTNGDGIVSVLDATLTQKHISQLSSISEDRLYYADVDGNKTISIVDATLIQKFLANIIGEFPVETTIPETTAPYTDPTTTPDVDDYTPIDNISNDILTAEMLWKIEEGFYNLVNEERTSQGLEPLTYNKHLDDVAQIRSLELTELFSHTRPDGTSCFTAIDYDIYPYKTAGENICYFHHLSGSFSYDEWIFTGSDKQLKNAAENVFNLFKNSPGHYANMISEDFENAGIGISYIWEDNIDAPRFYLSHNFGTKLK